MEIRLVKKNELKQLLGLYQHLNPEDPELNLNEELYSLWEEIYNDPNSFYLVLSLNGILVSSCTIEIIKNLTRSARPYAVIENVVTHQDYRQRGYASLVLRKAIEIAQEKNCYKIMLMTGRKESHVLEFYEKLGFKKGEKTAYVMRFDEKKS